MGFFGVLRASGVQTAEEELQVKACHINLWSLEGFLVVYPRHADKYLGPLANRLREANQPVSRTPSRFLTPHPYPLAGI
jgi:hypothetical protein